MNKTYKNRLIFVILSLFLLLYLLNTKFIVSNIVDYSIIFFKNLFPATFVFYTFSNLLVDYGFIHIIERILRVKGTLIYIFFMSLISGFPSGAKYTTELLEKGLIDNDTANKYIMFSHFPNPFFVFNTINLILNNVSVTFKLFISLIFSNIIIMFLFKSKSNNSVYFYNHIYPKSFSSSLLEAFNNTFKVILLIYCNSLFFFLIVSVLLKYLSYGKYFIIILSGFFDLTKGVYSVIAIDNIFIKSMFIIIFISFGGISIHMQVCSLISNSLIKYRYFLLGRFIATIISLCIFSILVII